MALELSRVIKAFGDPLGGRPPRVDGEGRITVDHAWGAANIVPIMLPYGQGREWKGYCHRLLAPLFKAVFADLQGAGLLHLVETIDGCYVARLVRGGVSLSRHTFGIALDCNQKHFPRGSLGQQNHLLILAFAKHGFRCGQKDGGLWENPEHWDPMHFEFLDLSLLLPEAAENDMAAIPVSLPGGRRVAGTLENGHLYAPVREVAESLGGKVEWDGGAKAATITKAED